MAELLGLRWRLVLLMALALAPLSLLVLLAVFYPVDVAAMRTTVLGAAALAELLKNTLQFIAGNARPLVTQTDA